MTSHFSLRGLFHPLALAALLLAGSAAADKPEAPAPDHAAIAQVVDSYRQFVGAGDRKGFETLLLDKAIVFSSVSAHQPVADSNVLKNYASFDQGVFSGAYPYRQHFSNVKIEQVGPLAQVSLTFTVERLDGKGRVDTGWKILQLVKSDGAWKIASELYTFDMN